MKCTIGPSGDVDRIIIERVKDFDKDLCLGLQKKIEERLKELEVRELGIAVKEFSCSDASAPPEQDTCPVELGKQCGVVSEASAPPSAPPRIGKHMAEQQYLYCIGIINKAIDDSVTKPDVGYCHKMIVHKKLAERLAEHYTANGFTASVDSHVEDLSEIKISLW